jgi:hypothetical protein
VRARGRSSWRGSRTDCVGAGADAGRLARSTSAAIPGGIGVSVPHHGSDIVPRHAGAGWSRPRRTPGVPTHRFGVRTHRDADRRGVPPRVRGPRRGHEAAGRVSSGVVPARVGQPVRPRRPRERASRQGAGRSPAPAPPARLPLWGLRERGCGQPPRQDDPPPPSRGRGGLRQHRHRAVVPGRVPGRDQGARVVVGRSCDPRLRLPRRGGPRDHAVVPECPPARAARADRAPGDHGCPHPRVHQGRHHRDRRDGHEHPLHPQRGQAVPRPPRQDRSGVRTHGAAVPAGAHPGCAHRQGGQAGCHDRLQGRPYDAGPRQARQRRAVRGTRVGGGRDPRAARGPQRVRGPGHARAVGRRHRRERGT